jgi:hypothetical protein
MDNIARLRGVIVGLLGFAAAEEEMLLTADTPGRSGPDRWAAVPLVAHTTEFKLQQAERIRAVRSGQMPRAYAEIDHSSTATYNAYASRSTADVIDDFRRTTAELMDGVRALSGEDLVDSGRHPWLNGRTLWLQVIVRGFWHPTGHIADYYLRREWPDRAVALQEHALATTRYLGAPDQAAGMAAYSLACAHAQAGMIDEAAKTLTEAITLNPDVRANASRDADLAPLRDSGQLTGILAVLPAA